MSDGARNRTIMALGVMSDRMDQAARSVSGVRDVMEEVNQALRHMIEETSRLTQVNLVDAIAVFDGVRPILRETVDKIRGAAPGYREAAEKATAAGERVAQVTQGSAHDLVTSAVSHASLVRIRWEGAADRALEAADLIESADRVPQLEVEDKLKEAAGALMVSDDSFGAGLAFKDRMNADIRAYLELV